MGTIERSALVTTLMRVPRVGRVVRRCHDRWLDAKYQLYRDHTRNPSSRRMFIREAPALDDVQRQAVDDLKERGLAMLDFRALMLDRWDAVSRAGSEFRESRDVVGETQAFRTTGRTTPGKAYLIRRSAGTRQQLALDDEILRTGLDARLLNIVNSYLGLWAKLTDADLWFTIPVGSGRPKSDSQRWHRDHEDTRLVKAFLYLSDVDEGAGPFQYIPASRPGGPWGELWRRPSILGQPYPPQDEVERTIAATDSVTCTCPAGTLVLCDTSGLHCGGYATEHERLSAIWTYVSPASLWSRNFVVERADRLGHLAPAARFALS
jgi:hypothetical protein